MPTLFPDIKTEAEFEALRPNPEPWRPAIAEICRRHHLQGQQTFMEMGSYVLFGVGTTHLVKLFQPWWLEHYETERQVMERVHNTLPVPSPHLIAADKLEGWGYVVMTRLPGVPIAHALDQLTPTDHARIATQVGELAAAFHAAPIAGLESLPPAWPAFLSGQIEGCVARHQGHGHPAPLVEEIAAHIQSADLDPIGGKLLHTELTHQNLLAEKREDGWHLSGVVDFEPSMLGTPDYDLLGASIFICRGNAVAHRSFLEAYGLASSDINEPLIHRLMAYTLLHRYSHLAFFWRQVSTDPFPTKLDTLTRHFCPL